MKFFELLKFSFLNLWRRKLRSSLTLLGVMIGTASIVVMMSLGIGLNNTYIESIKNSGTLTLITVDNYGGGMMYAGGGMGSASIDKNSTSEHKKLDKAAVESFANLEHVVCSSPVYQFTVIAKSGKYESYLSINAMTYEMLSAMKLPVLKGELPAKDAPLSLIAGSHVGFNFYDPKASSNDMMYFGGDMDLEPPVKMYDTPIFIVYDVNAYNEALNGKGAMPKKYLVHTSALLGTEDSNNGWSQYDYNTYAQLESVEALFNKIFKKNPWPNQNTDSHGKPIRPLEYNTAYVLVDDIENVSVVQKAIGEMGYQSSSDLDYLKSMQEQSRTIQYVLAGIGSVSLIVAAIGITNTMLMSIFERTKEIGIFKVLGCSLGNIRSMFLVEAGMIGLGGGLLGLGLSFGLSTIINLAIGAISVIPVWLALLGLGFSVGVGMIAGLSPAIRATKLSPLEAIRSL
ncbi:MAG: ABC transporter permease [Oscillospiraceae bacterium]